MQDTNSASPVATKKDAREGASASPPAPASAPVQKTGGGFFGFIGRLVVFGVLLAAAIIGGVYALNHYGLVKYAAWESAYNALTGKTASANEPVFEKLGNVKAQAVTLAGKDVAVRTSVKEGVNFTGDPKLLGDPAKAPAPTIGTWAHWVTLGKGWEAFANQFEPTRGINPNRLVLTTPRVIEVQLPDNCNWQVNPGQQWDCAARINTPLGQYRNTNGGEFDGMLWVAQTDAKVIHLLGAYANSQFRNSIDQIDNAPKLIWYYDVGDGKKYQQIPVKEGLTKATLRFEQPVAETK